MHLLVAGAAGWGKGYLAQILVYNNMIGETFDAVIVLDTSNEFRGLVSSEHGPAPATHWAVTEREATAWDRQDWQALIGSNRNLVLQRGVAKGDEWQEAAAEIVMGARLSSLDVLVTIDEGHGLAPQSGGSYPEELEKLVTDGRTEGGAATSSMWLTQRLAQIDKNITENCNARFLGGFEGDNSLSSVGDILPYPKEMHATGGQPVNSSIPEKLLTDGEAISVRKWTEPDEDGEPQTVNSEWIYTDETGKLARKQSNDYTAVCDHVGASGKRIDVGI
ncbi:hypothetical protein BRC71_06310 [Halobacteriales archaeon QH_7_65_31]|nr:MAG: hypothetical protein BRC71_06310 [Halobacteriales archaeon QH_7_65_31]